MNNNRKLKISSGLVIGGAFLMLAFQNCSQTKFTKSSVDLASNASGATESKEIMTVDKSYSFSISSQTNNKMDILFIIDNSGSMAAEQLKLSKVFQNFIASVSGLDYRIAITTTDNSNTARLGTYGKLLPLRLKIPGVTSGVVTDLSPISAADIFYIDSATVNAQSLFIDTIQTGINGASSEKGMSSIKNFVTNSLIAGSAEAQFIRPEAIFSTIVVTDADQAQYEVMSSSSLIGHISSSYSNSKTYVNHSSIVLPGDTVCRSTGETYGVSYFELSALTGGVNASLCSLDYAAQFRLISEVLIGKVSEQKLECEPVDADANGSLDVAVYDSAGIEITGYTVINSTVKFASTLSNIDTYNVRYKCAQ